MNSSAFAIIIDDEKDVGVLLSTFLKNAGFEVKCALTLHEAHEIISNYKPKLVLLDIHLPDGSGFELVETLRSRNPEVKIIVQSAYEGSQEQQKLKEYQLDYFLPKPIDLNKLRELVA